MASCLICNSLRKREDGARLGFEFAPNQLESSVQTTGCPCCITLLNGIKASQDLSWSFTEHVRCVYVRCHGKRQEFLETLSLEIYFKDDRPKLELEFFSQANIGWNGILPRTSISGHPLSHTALTWVSALLTNCAQKHLCSGAVPSHSPKRLLAIRIAEDGQIKVKLVEPEKLSAPYIALSHCWGTERSCMTTRETLADNKQDIPWNSIPKTHQDAIKFSLKLNIKYIWIDSICIVQDDEADWEIESSKMADVYQHSYLTLAATSSSGDSKGCYPDIEGPSYESEIDVPEGATGISKVFIRRPLKHWNNLPATMVAQEFPLLSRGWVFQEKLISPRILHFCSTELVWECHELSVCECGGFGANDISREQYLTIRTCENTNVAASKHPIVDTSKKKLAQRLKKLLRPRSLTKEGMLEPEKLSGDPYESEIQSHATSATDNTSLPLSPNSLTFLITLPSNPEPFNKKSEIATQFHRAVEAFSGLKLTKPTDRLPALSGLCKRIQHLRGSYLAGLWSDSLYFDLLWRVDTLDPGTGHGRPADHRRPSWSWVAVDGPVKYWHDIMAFKVDWEWVVKRLEDPNISPWRNEVRGEPLGWRLRPVTVSIERHGQNPYGSVSRAVLMVEASCVTATLLYADSPYWGGGQTKDLLRYMLHVHGCEIQFFPDYAIGVEGPHRIESATKVKLLFIHPEVSLVLKPSITADEARTNEEEIIEEILWERIGILRASEIMTRSYRMNLLEGSQVESLRIV